MRWEYDPEHGGLLFVRLAEGQVEGTIRLDADTLVDVASDGLVLGIEVLNGEERLPFLKDHSRGSIEVAPEPLLAFFVSRNDAKNRELLARFVEHVIGILRHLSMPIS